MIGIFYVSHITFGDFVSSRFLLGGKKKTWWESKFIGNGYSIIILHEYNCVQIPSENFHKASMNDKPCEMGCGSKTS